MEYCCYGSQNMFRNVGQRGIALIVRLNFEGDPRIALQSRGVDFDEIPVLERSPVREFSINVACEIGVRFCPFCGARFEDVIRRNPEFYLDLAKVHEKYRNGPFEKSEPGLSGEGPG